MIGLTDMRKNTFSKFFICFFVVIFVSGCAGKTANPIMVSQYGDEQKSCNVLKFEMITMQNNMQDVLPKTEKTGKNVALGVAGAFFLVPWFFMDFSSAEQVEYEAYRNRYNHLASIAISKECGIEKKVYPSAEELKKLYEQKKEQEKLKDKVETKK